MSYNISKNILDYADSIDVKIDLTKLGPRQRKALDRYMKTGVVVGYSAPALIAQSIRRNLGLPVVRFGRYGRFFAFNVPPTSSVYEELIVAIAAARLSGREDLSWQQRASSDASVWAQQRTPDAYFWLTEAIAEEFDAREFDFPAAPTLTDRFVTITVWRDKEGETI